MIGTSWWEYLFIRSCIVFLHYIAPLCSLYCVVVLLVQPASYRIPVILEVWACAEMLFFVLIYWPRYYGLQKKATHPPPLSQGERRALFRKCNESVQDPQHYLSKWFRGAPVSEIRRENVKEWLCWAFLNKSSVSLLDDPELEEYTIELEKILGRKIPSGRGRATPLRLTLDKVNTLNRSLLWYLVRRGWEPTELSVRSQDASTGTVTDTARTVCFCGGLDHLHVYVSSLFSLLSSAPSKLSNSLSTSSADAIHHPEDVRKNIDILASSPYVHYPFTRSFHTWHWHRIVSLCQFLVSH